MTDEDQGGRVFFSSTGRSLEGEDEIVVLSVGVDIGSSTSHLVFSRIVLERLDSRYVVTERETFYASDILLTPYSAENTIDAEALGAFIKKEYADAKVDPDEIDTGALILTGVAVQRTQRPRHRRLVRQAGRQARRGQRRRQPGNRDGGLRLGRGGALDPRRMRGDERRRRRRHLEDRGLRRRQGDRHRRGRCRRAADLPGAGRQDHPRGRGRPALRPGARHRSASRRHAHARSGPRPRRADGRQAVRDDARRRAHSAGRQACSAPIRSPIAGRSRRSSSPAACRSSSTATKRRNSAISARCWRRKSAPASMRSARGSSPRIEGIRATVVGASQYTIQLSGSTIYVAPLDAVPLRNVPVIAPALPLDQRDHRSRRGRARHATRCSSASISTAASSRSRCSCRGRARRRSSGSTRSAAAWSKDCRACWRTAIRWCWPATATSAACSASICTRR